MNSENTEVKKENVVIYDYITVEVKERTRQLIIDTYENLGWEMVSKGFGLINFKRDHRLNNKIELNKIQEDINQSLKNIEKYEETKKQKGLIVSLVIGILGSLIMGTGMALIMEFEEMMFGILLGILGIIICIPAYPLYKQIVTKSVNKVLPLIDSEYDKIADLCDKAVVLMK